MLLITLAMMAFAYLIGSISSAVLICKCLNLPDPRSTGSRNPGATNVLRISNYPTAGLVLLLDILKGTIPVWGAYFLQVDAFYLGLIAVAACLGHMYPIFFQFQGGKGVATAFGALAPIGLGFMLLLIITWLAVLKSTRYSSLAAIVTVSLAPFYTWLIKPLYTYPVLMLSALIVFRHKDNILRLINKQEPKV
jgi:glycerol-3-phosphate acyltransferase PlsY